MSKKSDNCHHIKATGEYCQSPALRDDRYCYFHRVARQRYKRLLRRQSMQQPLQLPLLEDRESIQLAIGEVLNALLANRIEQKVAKLLLQGLQMAAKNAAHIDFDAYSSSDVPDEYTNEEQESLDAEIASDNFEDLKEWEPDVAEEMIKSNVNENHARYNLRITALAAKRPECAEGYVLKKGPASDKSPAAILNTVR